MPFIDPGNSPAGSRWRPASHVCESHLAVAALALHKAHAGSPGGASGVSRNHSGVWSSVYGVGAADEIHCHGVVSVGALAQIGRDPGWRVDLL